MDPALQGGRLLDVSVRGLYRRPRAPAAAVRAHARAARDGAGAVRRGALDELAPKLGFESAADVDKAYLAAAARPPSSRSMPCSTWRWRRRPDALASGLAGRGAAARPARRGGGAGTADGASCSPSSPRRRHHRRPRVQHAGGGAPAPAMALPAEQTASGGLGRRPIGAEVLAKMPALDAFALDDARVPAVAAQPGQLGELLTVPLRRCARDRAARWGARHAGAFVAHASATAFSSRGRSIRRASATRPRPAALRVLVLRLVGRR